LSIFEIIIIGSVWKCPFVPEPKTTPGPTPSLSRKSSA
jgi:hypothetical protein